MKLLIFFVHVSLLILYWEGIAEQLGQVAPTNLGSFSDNKLSRNDYTNKKTSNLLDTKNLPRKTKVPFSKVIIRQFF